MKGALVTDTLSSGKINLVVDGEGEMDASLPGGVPTPEVPLQVEASLGAGSTSTEVGNIARKEGTSGVLEVQSTRAPNVEQTKNVEVQHVDDGSSKTPSHVSKGGTNEDSTLASLSIFGSNAVSTLQNSETRKYEVLAKGHGSSLKKSSRENGAQKEEEEQNGPKGVAKEIPQVRIESQLPMRQLARKGGLLKGEAAFAPKSVPSIADAVKEGILKKEKEEQDRKEAIEAVMGVHGRKKEVTGHAALFPGVIGPESGRLCHCCSCPESSKSTIFCDKCERGFHVDCVKHWSKPAQEHDVWHCGPCGLQPGHYWPLGKVLISYETAVAKYQKYSSKFLTTLQRKEDSSFSTFSLGMEQRPQEKFDGFESGATKVKVMRDFKKEARKGATKASVAVTPIQPIVSKAGLGMPMHAKHSGKMTVMKVEPSTGVQALGGTLQQPKTINYPGFVPIQPKSVLNSVIPMVNFLVPPEVSVLRTLAPPKASGLANHQSKTILPLTEYTVSSTPGFTHTGSISTHVTPPKLMYTKSKDLIISKAISSQPETAPSGPQSQKTLVVNQYVALPQSNAIGPSNLSSATNQINVQQKAALVSGVVGLEVSSTEELRPFALGEHLSEREELLREAKESLNQLQTFISALKGNLGEGWQVILRKRPTGAQEKFYLSPAKRKYRSRLDVGRFLGLVDDPRLHRTKSNDLGTSLDKYLDKKVTSTPATEAIEVTNLPMFFGDVMIEKLGLIDSRLAYSDEHHLWPVGFRSSWHDPETGSYCISEVENGGELGPIFRVTRKLVIGPASSNNNLLATSTSGKTPPGVDGLHGEAGKMKVSEEKSSPLKSSLEGVKANIGDSGIQKLEGCNKLGNEKVGISLLDEGHEGGGISMNGDSSHGLPKNHIVANHSMAQTVIDLTEEKELLEECSKTTLDTRVSALIVKTSSNTSKTSALENPKADNLLSQLPPVVIDLSDEEDDKPSVLLCREKGPTPNEEDVEVTDVVHHKAVGFLPPHMEPLPNILMEELIVEAQTPGEAWKLFGKQFVEQCKKSLGSGVNCIVPTLEATNDYVIYNSGTSQARDGGSDLANSALLRQKSIDRREITKALFYERLEKRLGEDRFGLNLLAVQNMIKALRIGRLVSHDKAWIKGVDQIVDVAHIAAMSSPSIKENVVNPPAPWKRRKRKNKADVAGEESVKKLKSSSIEPVAPHLLNLGAGEQSGIENVVFQNLPPIVMPTPVLAPLSVPAMGLGQVLGPTTTTTPVPPSVIIIEEPCQPPPTGQPILKRVPAELVGDLLQVWEFLCRFSDLLGQDVHFTLEDLEAGLLDLGPVRSRLDVMTEAKDYSGQFGEKDDVSAALGSPKKIVSAGLEEEKNVHGTENSCEKDPMKGDKVLDESIISVDSRHDKVPDLDQDKDLNAIAKTQTGVTSSLSACMEDAERKENSSKDLEFQGNELFEGRQSGMKNLVAFFDGTSKGLAFLAEAHIPLLKFLVSDLKFRISRSLNEDEADEPKKRGRKRICDMGVLPPEFGDDLPMNAITWPEVAHRYLVAILDVKKQGEMIELAPEERKKLVRYFEGDGGVMGGAVEGVVGVESDAQVLAEAEKELTLRTPKIVEKDIVIFVPQEWDVALTPINPVPKKAKGGKTGELHEVLPKWVEALEPVRKMPTNLGTKIRNQVQESLDCKPPNWAKATLDWSLNKGTFKSNAAGTTKRAVLEVLAQYHGEELKAINAPRVRKVKTAPSIEHLMQRCRIVLREVAKADTKQVFSNLVGGAFFAKSSKGAEILARPLDFQTIDARLAAGAYGGSTDAFAADMRQVWKNVEEVHQSGSAILELAGSLSQLFEKLYQKQVSRLRQMVLANNFPNLLDCKEVISLIKGMSETKDREKEKATLHEVDGLGKMPINNAGKKTPRNVVDDKLGKAPWEDDTTCRVCGIDEDYDSILLCDGCDAEYHTYCLVPPLEKVPEGNWFCPSCVAVEEGFPEAPPSLGEAELATLQEEMEKPVAGSILKLEYEDEKVPSDVLDKKHEVEMMGRVLRFGTKSKVEVEDEAVCGGLNSQPPIVESTIGALLREWEEKEYWQLSFSYKLFLLKFLCDEALKTSQVRAHLEKSVEVALELHQQLRDLIAERLKIVVPLDVTRHAKPVGKETLQKHERTTSQQRASSDATQTKDGVEAVAEATRLELQALKDAEASKVTTMEIGKVIHDLDLNVVVGKELESEHFRPNHKALDHADIMCSRGPVSVAFDASLVETSKEKPLVNVSVLDEKKKEQVVREEGGGTQCANVVNHASEGLDSCKSVLSQLSLVRRLGPQQDPIEDLKLHESQGGHILVTSVPEGVVGDVSILADAAMRPLNPLKRGLETTASDLPSTSINGHENVKKPKKEESAVGFNGVETNHLSKGSSDGQATVAKVLEDEDGHISTLQSARVLDGKITKLGAKLFNLSLRREHMGTDHLGREYWALTGIDGRPWLVVADIASTSQDQRVGKEEKKKDASDLKMVQEGIKWIHYKGDKALDELVKWLSPRCQHERALRVAIYHWRRSLYPRHLLDMPEIMTTPIDARACITTEPSKVVDESGAVKDTFFSGEIEESKKARSFPAVKATRLLLKRYAAPNASGGEKDNELQRCECLELLWTSRLHCQVCHETYESTGEFQIHSNNCPPGSKPNRENGFKETQPQIISKAKKFIHDGSKVVKTKRLSSFDKAQDLNQSIGKGWSATKAERSRRGPKRGGSETRVDDDVDMEPVESMELLSDYAESLQAEKISALEVRTSIEHTPSNGILKALEELIEPSSSTMLSQPSKQPVEPTPEEPRVQNETFAATFTVEDWDANSLPAKFGMKRDELVLDTDQLQKPQGLSSHQMDCSNNLESGQDNSVEWVDDLNISNRSVRESGHSNPNQFNCSSNPQGGQGNIGGWVNDLNISNQELYAHQSNCSSISQDGHGNNGGWVNDLNISSQSFTEQVLDANGLNCAKTRQGGHSNSGGWVNDLNVATKSFKEDSSPSFEYHSPAPTMVSTPMSTREGTSQIGFQDRGPSFAPPLQNSLIVDSSLMTPSSLDYPSMEGFPSLESANSAVSQYQQFLPPHNTLGHTPVPNTNFLLSLNNTHSKSISHSQFFAPIEHANPPLSFQQLLSSHDSLNLNFLPSPNQNVNTTPLSFTNLLHSLDHRNPQLVLHSNPQASSFSNLNTYTNPSAIPYVNLNSNLSPSSSHHTNFSTHYNPSASHHTSLNANPNPSLYTSLNASNPPPSSHALFPLSNNIVEPETKKFDVGRFNSNLWFDSHSTVDPLPIERPAVIPTKPTARRTSTWDYLINLPLPSSSQGHERSVQRDHVPEAHGGHSTPPPIEVGSLPFDLMFEKPHREDLNISTAPEEDGTLTLDRMFEGQQIERQINNSTGDSISMGADSVTLDLMLEKHEQGVLHGETGPNEVGSLCIDLMSLPEEQIEIVQADAMDTAEEACVEGVQDDPIGDAKETCSSGDVQVDCTEAARRSTCLEVDCSEAVAKESSVDNVDHVQVDPDGDACVEDVEVVEAQREAEVDRVDQTEEVEEVGTSSEQRIILPPPILVVGASSGRKQVKRFPVVSASMRPLVGELKFLLKGLQISLLDMEAAMASDVLESSRASPVRRRAWRAFVKSASCIYEVTKAIILLELMVKAECLKPNWGYWSSFSAAARSSSLSSLALRLFALDAAITYERLKVPGDGREVITSNSKSLKTKKKKPVELPPPPKKKKRK